MLFLGKRNFSLLCLYLLRIRSDQWSIYKFISEFWDSPVHPWSSAKPNQRVPYWSLDYHVTCHFFLFVFCTTFAGHVVFLFIKHQPWKDLNLRLMFFCMKWECEVKKIIFPQWLAKLMRVHSKTQFLLVFGMHVVVYEAGGSSIPGGRSKHCFAFLGLSCCLLHHWMLVVCMYQLYLKRVMLNSKLTKLRPSLFNSQQLQLKIYID